MPKIYGQLEFAQLHNRTNAQRPAAATAGLIIWNTDAGQIQVDNGTTWENVLTGSAISPIHDYTLNGSINQLYDDFDGAHYALAGRTISNLSITAINSGTSGTTTVELYKNGAASGQTVSLASAAGAAAGATASITLAVVAGDRITVRMTARATGLQTIRVEHD